MSLPKSLKIMGHTVHIRLRPRLENEDHGQADWQKKEILISQAYPESQQWLTLRHEVLHIILGLSGLSEVLTSEQEEAIVVCFENNLTPDLFNQTTP